MRNSIVVNIYLWFFMTCCLFCLWMLSNHFLNDLALSYLLFPFGLRTGIALHCDKKYWDSIYSAELILIIAVGFLFNPYDFLFLIVASIISIGVIAIAQKHYHGNQWKRLYVIGLVIFVTSSVNGLCYYLYYDSLWLALLSSVAGGLMLVPSCYLVWSYLFQNSWEPLTATLAGKPVNLRKQHILFFLLLFTASIFAQSALPEELSQFAPFCLAIPIILLAYHYGWQGALLATLFNGIAIIATHTGANLSTTDLLLSISAQTLTGVLLGVGIQRQRELNSRLKQELTRNKNLTRKLIKAEEGVRSEVAREIHDEIGQNITAIRIKSSILQRINSDEKESEYARSIEQLSLNIYDTTRGLLERLRPKSLDDLGLKGAVNQLINELEFDSQHIKVSVLFKIEESELNDVFKATLFRITQEALNNIIKYAKASEVKVSFSSQTVDEGSHFCLSIADNGIGFKAEETKRGLGLAGIKERVIALGGEFNICSVQYDYQGRSGTKLTVVLPAN
ncbi:signal transduction histidine-protein kinase/phosphatase UhpB [Vibrio sp. SCSIO 43137]|uniref:signal transduction histidine-protein kinase/phosphatase UhpB n=1 Tax=Vibrio sp. SCSIO 43137 TaxID=3021011 RepID=UPI0023070DD0|nr:signal transduction histidine-protein kinase/phosphatase UhpB [Vibrio sp. SCSIO 43137]WCE31797.1 signal transduction histidine-protein kinase/phosphatase UhpB [Vibrio sp. SCSIO 43137]